jgi:hypothetical protein
VIIPSVKLADTVLPFGRVMTSPLVVVSRTPHTPYVPSPEPAKPAVSIKTVEPEPSGPRSKGVIPSNFLSFPIASKVTGVLYVVTTFGSSTTVGPGNLPETGARVTAAMRPNTVLRLKCMLLD